MNRKAFSLVELLVVVAIVALLAALVLPGLARAREYAYFTKCKSNQRQAGIGFLIYGSDNGGRMPEGETPCDGESAWNGRRYGGKAEVWMYSNTGGTSLVRKIYMDGASHKTWFMTEWGWMVGEPRNPGRYLPIEILWDPIVKVRDWGPWGHHGPTMEQAKLIGLDPDSSDYVAIYSGEECCRDFISRWSHGWGGGKFGYEFFVNTVGCPAYRADRTKDKHVLQKFGGSGNAQDVEQPIRWATQSCNVSISHKPSVWLAACLVPGKERYGLARNWRSHFGIRRSTYNEFRFNVLHLDGHVHDSSWKVPEAPNSISWFENQHPNHGWKYGVPYGWDWMPDRNDGLKPEPDFRGAFDTGR